MDGTAAPPLIAIATIILLLWCMATRPTSWRAARGWYINGARPSGSFGMRPGDGRDLEIRGRLYCTGGATPRVWDTSVWCQR